MLRPGEADEDRFERSRRIGWLKLDSVFKARAMVVGAGALGNEVAKNLLLSGFRRITIVDMDHVVGSNLNRCLFFTKKDVVARGMKAEVVARGLSAMSDDVDPVPIVGRVEDVPDSTLKRQSVILGCLDNIQSRMNVNSRAYSLGLTYIDGGMIGFVGKVMIARPPGACLQCGMNRSHAKVAGLRFSCTGKNVVFHEPRLAAEITTTSIVSAVMVREALKMVSGRTDLILANAFFYDGQRNVSEEMEVPLDPGCPVHRRG